MSKAPAMPMYWDAYISDTTHLSTEEHGAYLLMLGAMWRRNGFIPDDDADNARITGLSKAKWKRFKCRISDMIDIANGEISQQKLIKTWKITQEKIQKNRENGSKGGRPKLKEIKDLEKANGFVSLNPNESIPEPEPEPLLEIGKPISCIKAKPKRFQEFWNNYPHRGGAKKGRAKSELKYSRHIAAGISEAEIINGAMKYCSDRSVIDGYAKNPETWLNNQCWNDEIEITKFAAMNGNGNGKYTSNSSDANDPTLQLIADVVRSL